MRIIKNCFSIVFVLLFGVCRICANDSLTRFQVFNFQIGDTLYYEENIDEQGFGFNKTNLLKIVLDKDYNMDSSIVTYTTKQFRRQERYNGGSGQMSTSIDTLVAQYGDMDSLYIETFQGMYWFDTATGISDRMAYDSTNAYWKRDTLNGSLIYSFSYIGLSGFNLSYAADIGVIRKSYYYEYDNTGKSEELVAYSLANGNKSGTLFKAFPVGIIEMPKSILSIYPNPFTDKLHIDFDESITNGNSTIVVRDIYGKVIKELKDLHQQNEISLADESPGLYFLTLQSGTNYKTWKVMKE